MLTFKRQTPAPSENTSAADDLRRALVRSLELLMELAKATDLPVQQKVHLRRMKMAAAQARGDVEMAAIAMDIQALKLEATRSSEGPSADSLVAGAASALEGIADATMVPGLGREIRRLAATPPPNPAPPALEEFAGESARIADAVRFLRNRGDVLSGTASEMAAVLRRLSESHPDVLSRLEGTQHALEEAAKIEELEVLRERLLSDAKVLVEDARGRVRESEQSRSLLEMHQSSQVLLQRSLADAQALVATDALTGLGNRRALEEYVKSDALTSDSVSVVVVELDAYSSIRAAGLELADQVVRQLAARILGELREGEAAFRLDSGTFVLTLSGSIGSAKPRLETLRTQVSSRPMRVQADDVKVTLSIGASEWKGGTAFREVLAAADQRRSKIATRGGNGLSA